MAEGGGGGDDKRRRVVGAQGPGGLAAYLKATTAAARAEAAERVEAARTEAALHAGRARVIPVDGHAADINAFLHRIKDEGVRPEFARFFVSKERAAELGRPELETSHMPCDPAVGRAGHRCTKDCLLRLMAFQPDWLAHAAPIAERLAAARGVPMRDVVAPVGRHEGRAGPARGAAVNEQQRAAARNRDLKIEDECVALECVDLAGAAGCEDGVSGWAFVPSFEPSNPSEYLTHTWRAAVESTEAFTRAMAVEMLAAGFVAGGPVCCWCIKTVLCVGNSYLWGDKKPDRMTVWACEAAGVPVGASSRAAADPIARMSARDVAQLDASTGQACTACSRVAAGQRRPPCSHLRVDAKVIEHWRQRWDACAHEPSVFKSQNKLLVELLWDKSTHRESGLAIDMIRRALPVSARRLHHLRRRCRLARDSGDYELLHAIEHGRITAGLLRGPPANKIAFEARDGIWEHLDLYTRTDPVKPLLRCTTQDMNSVRALWRNFVVANPEWAVSLSTFQRATRDFCDAEGVKGIKGSAPDHNVCDVCKVFDELRGRILVLIKKLKADIAHINKRKAAIISGSVPKADRREELSKLRLPVALLENILGALEKLYLDIDTRLVVAHHALNKEMRQFVASVVALGRALEVDLLVKNGVGGGGDALAGLGSQLLIKVTHTDDKSSAPDPHPKNASSETLYKHDRIINGQADLINNRFWALLHDCGHSSKDAAKVWSENFMTMLETLKGERVIVQVYDCGPLNHGCYTALQMTQLVVDLGLADACFTVFYQPKHGKGECDKYFGIISEAMRQRTYIGLDSIARVVESLMSDLEKQTFMKCMIMMPSANCDWKPFVGGLYQDEKSPAFKAFRFKRFHPQMCVAANPAKILLMQEEAAKGTEAQRSLVALVQRFMAEDAGVVRCWRKPSDAGADAPAMHRDFPVWSLSPQWRPAQRLFEVCTGTKQRRGNVKSKDGGAARIQKCGFNAWAFHARGETSWWADLLQCGGHEGHGLWLGGKKGFDTASCGPRNKVVRFRKKNFFLPTEYEARLFNGLPGFGETGEGGDGDAAQAAPLEIKVVSDSEDPRAVETKDSVSARALFDAFNADPRNKDPLRPVNMFWLVEKILEVHLRETPAEFVAARTLPKEVNDRVLRHLNEHPVKERDDLRFEAPHEIATEPSVFYEQAALPGTAEQVALAEIVGSSTEGPAVGIMDTDQLTRLHLDCHSAATQLYHFRHATAMLSHNVRQPSAGATRNILGYSPLPPHLGEVKGIYRVKRLNALAQVVGTKAGDMSTLHVVLHEGSAFDMQYDEWYAAGGPHELFENPPSTTHTNCTRDREKLRALGTHVTRWLQAHASALEEREAEKIAMNAAGRGEEPEEEEEEEEDAQIVSDDSEGE